MEVDGHPKPSSAESLLDVLKKSLKAGNPLNVRVERGGASVVLTVTPVTAASHRVRLVYSQAINALATGSTVEVNLGMLEFCENDTELAFVFAHELAHNALRHHRDFVFNYLLGTAGDLALLALSVPSANILGLTALHWPSSGYEVEADYVALYLLARSDHDLELLRGFWPRMALTGPERRASRHSLWSHPEPAERQILLEYAIAEIHRHRQAGLPLEPPPRNP